MRKEKTGKPKRGKTFFPTRKSSTFTFRFRLRKDIAGIFPEKIKRQNGEIIHVSHVAMQKCGRFQGLSRARARKRVQERNVHADNNAGMYSVITSRNRIYAPNFLFNSKSRACIKLSTRGREYSALNNCVSLGFAQCIPLLRQLQSKPVNQHYRGRIFRTKARYFLPENLTFMDEVGNRAQICSNFSRILPNKSA